MIPKEPYKGGRQIGRAFSDRDGYFWHFYVKNGSLWGQRYMLTRKTGITGNEILSRTDIEATEKEMEDVVLQAGLNFSKSKVWIQEWANVRRERCAEMDKAEKKNEYEPGPTWRMGKPFN